MKSELIAGHRFKFANSIGLRREVKSELTCTIQLDTTYSIGLRREVKSEPAGLNTNVAGYSIGLRREVKSELTGLVGVELDYSIGLRREVKSEHEIRLRDIRGTADLRARKGAAPLKLANQLTRRRRDTNRPTNTASSSPTAPAIRRCPSGSFFPHSQQPPSHFPVVMSVLTDSMQGQVFMAVSIHEYPSGR